MRREAQHIEELRTWAASDSAFLNDKDHSMWVKKEEDDNALITMEELSERSRLAAALRAKGRE